MRITYVITYKHRSDRILHLRKVLEWLNGFSNIDVVLVEQDTHSKIKHLSLKAKHIFIKNNGVFNKSWAYNVAIKRNQNPIIIFGDSDIIMNPHEFIAAINEISNYDVISPYSSVLDLTREESEWPFANLLAIQRPGRGETDNQKINLCGGITIFKTEAIMKIGGWCEEFIAWGGEDDAQAFKVKNSELTYKEMPYRCYHFFHTRDDMDMKLYQRNLQILDRITKMTKDELLKYISVSVPKIGIMNKYF